MTLPSRYDLSDKAPLKNYTFCESCECVKHDSEFYKRTPNTCMECVDKPYQESDSVWRRNRPEAMRY